MLRYFVLLFWCSIAAVLTASFAGEDLALSLKLWLASFVSWFAAALLLGLLSRADLVPSRFRLLTAASNEESSSPQALHAFRSLESLLLRSRDNERTHRQQLRPRLATLADHFLLVHHGINRDMQPEQAAAVLGDAAWLIADDQTTRTPTLEEVDLFLDRLLLPENNPERTA